MTKLYELTPKGSQVVKSLQTLRHSLSRGRGLTVRKIRPLHREVRQKQDSSGFG
ncbi:MAG: hypothetical protein RMH74_02390 [Candidatus Caldarchaeum sp.]|nr:hypothetical protein [Candidatus Caldarchaeum sp.]